MNESVTSERDPDSQLQKFDHLYGTLKRLTKTERDIKKLKLSIYVIEKKTRKYWYLQNERNGPHRRRKKLNSIVISKVYKKYVSTRRGPNDDIILNKDNCPKWLLLMADAYSALQDCYLEVREELKIICSKFGKQENYYTRMCDHRYKGWIEEFALKIEKVGKEVSSRFGGKLDKLTCRIDEQIQEIEERKQKEEKLKNVINQIQNEIRRIVSKYSGLCPTLHLENEFSEGVEERLREYLNTALEKAELSRKLRKELEEINKTIEKNRKTNRLTLSKMMEDIQNLQACYSEAMEKKSRFESKLSEAKETVMTFKEITTKLRSSKGNLLETLCKKEEDMEVLIQKFKIQKEQSPDKLDDKKRLQETYQSAYTRCCTDDKKFNEVLVSKNKKIEDTKAAVYEVKKNFIVPLKLKINEYKEKMHEIIKDAETAREKCMETKLLESKLKQEHSDLILLQKKVKYLITQTKSSLKKRQERLSNRSNSAAELSLCSENVPQNPEEANELLEKEQTLPLSSGSESNLSSNRTDGLDSSETSCQCEELEDTLHCIALDAENSSNEMADKINRMATLRNQESVLCRGILWSRMQVDPLQEATELIAFALLTKMAQLPRSFHSKEDTVNVTPKKRQISRIPVSIQKKSTPDQSTAICLKPRCSDIKTETDPATSLTSQKLCMTGPGDYVDKATRELHAEFSKLLFL